MAVLIIMTAMCQFIIIKNNVAFISYFLHDILRGCVENKHLNKKKIKNPKAQTKKKL